MRFNLRLVTIGLQLRYRRSIKPTFSLYRNNKLNMDINDPIKTFLTLSQVINSACAHGAKLGSVLKTLDPHSSLESDEPSVEESESSQKNSQSSENQVSAEEDHSMESPKVGDKRSSVFDDTKVAKKQKLGSSYTVGTRIKDLLADLYHYKPFALGGTVEIPDNSSYSLFIQSKDDQVPCGEICNLDYEKILEYCSVAPFGDLKTLATVVDTNVRNAFELEASKIIWKRYDSWNKAYERVTYSLSMFDSILFSIQRQFGDNTLTLVPYKLNIYKTGGFFKQHVDTPTDGEKMIGSLVVCFPSKFQGGDLIISHGDCNFKANFDHVNDKTITWAAFYSDCIHEVKPVTDGMRVTLTFSIIKSDDRHIVFSNSNTIITRAPQLPYQLERPINTLISLLREINIPKVGFLLSYKYTFKGLSAEILKGTDQYVYNGLTNAGFKCSLIPVVRHYYHVYGMEGEEDVLSNDVYRFTEDDINHLLGKTERPVVEDSDIPFFEISAGSRLLHSHQQGAEHTGNSSEPDVTDNLYFSAALVVTI